MDELCKFIYPVILCCMCMCCGYDVGIASSIAVVSSSMLWFHHCHNAYIYAVCKPI